MSVSTNADRSEVIVSTSDNVYLFRGSTARDVLKGLPNAPEGKESTQVCLHEGLLKAPIIMDFVPSECRPQDVLNYSSAAEIVEKLAKIASQVATVLCTAKLVPFLEFLNDDRSHKEKLVFPIILYAGCLISLPALGGARYLSGSRSVSYLMERYPSLKERYSRGHEMLVDGSLTYSHVLDALTAILFIRSRPRPVHHPHWLCSIALESGKVSSTRFHYGEPCSDLMPSPSLGTSIAVADYTTFGWIKRIDRVTFPVKGIHLFEAVPSVTLGMIRGAGIDMDHATARRKAAFECIERNVAASVRDLTVEATARELGVEIERFLPYADYQYSEKEFPYRRLELDTPIHWLPASTFEREEKTWIPASLISLDRSVNAIPLAPLSSYGIAAHSTLERAEIAALMELVERDVVTRSYFSGKMKELVLEEFVPELAEIVAGSPILLRAYVCEALELAPVAVVAVIDAAGFAALGSGCGHSLEDAVRGACFNAIGTYVYRATNKRLFKFANCWLEHSPPIRTKRHSLMITMPALIDRYKPLLVPLSGSTWSSLGIWVVGVWSGCAHDRPSSDQPIQIRKWNPTAFERGQLVREVAMLSTH